MNASGVSVLISLQLQCIGCSIHPEVEQLKIFAETAARTLSMFRGCTVSQNDPARHIRHISHLDTCMIAHVFAGIQKNQEEI